MELNELFVGMRKESIHPDDIMDHASMADTHQH